MLGSRRILVTRTLAVVAAGMAMLAIGATSASAATPDTPYDTLRIEAFDPQENGRFADRMDAAGDLDGAAWATCGSPRTALP